MRFIAGKGRSQTIHDFQDDIKSHSLAWNVLLIDSEGADDGKLLARSGFTSKQKDSVFWMVQLMESWFLADPQALKKYYGQGFREARLMAKRGIERIPKKDAMRWLENATKTTQKGKYDKTDHASRLFGPDRSGCRPQSVSQLPAHIRDIRPAPSGNDGLAG